MKIKNQCQIEARSAEIWDLFLDPEALRAAIPGCKSIELVGEDEYRAYLSLGISAIRGNYSGTVKIRDKVPTSSYRMIVEGNSSVGFAKGEGTII
ncbi:MAG: SRPBCC domain-containing protein, partial [Thermodesulfobacteriota bacterium]|nr:SRPBCC domain-containing protein [Thermodesulfobacteriota bacterium]